MKANRHARVADAKAKRQKITIIAGGGILALVLAIQVPKMISLLSPGGEQASAASEPASSTATRSAQPVAATPASSAASAATPADADLDGGVKATRFDAFTSKDPFAPQLTTSGAAASAAGDSDSSAGSTRDAANGAGLEPASAQPIATPTLGASTQSAAVAPSAAVISVNGVPATVAVGAAFPAGDPMFRLVKLASSAAKIAIAEGSYTNGAKAVSLMLHGSVTLLNTATGVRYRLQFVSLAP
jgi:hypothetical protein